MAADRLQQAACSSRSAAGRALPRAALGSAAQPVVEFLALRSVDGAGALPMVVLLWRAYSAAISRDAR